MEISMHVNCWPRFTIPGVILIPIIACRFCVFKRTKRNRDSFVSAGTLLNARTCRQGIRLLLSLFDLKHPVCIS